MAYYPDLSPYEYNPYLDGERFGVIPCPNIVNIGWLAKGHGFPVGKVDESFLDRLFVLCTNSHNVMRGYHSCDYCEIFGEDIPQVDRLGTNTVLGHSEIHVYDADGKVYVAPTLVYHYVHAHAYLPPPEFIEAVNRMLDIPPKESPLNSELDQGMDD